MKLSLLFLSLACGFSSAAKFGLLRIGQASTDPRKLEYRNNSNGQSGLFEEDFEAAFRELFANSDRRNSFSMSFGAQQPRIKESGIVEDTADLQTDTLEKNDLVEPERLVEISINYQTALNGPPREQIHPGKLDDAGDQVQAGHVVAFSIMGAVVLAAVALVVMKRMQGASKSVVSPSME